VQNPRASINRLNKQTGVTRRSVWRVLHFKLERGTYHLEVHDYISNTSEHMDLCLCLHKSKVYKTKIPKVHDLWQRIYEATQALTSNMLLDVFTSTVKRWEQRLEMVEGRLSCTEYDTQM
jgi:hypothetical protein